MTRVTAESRIALLSVIVGAFLFIIKLPDLLIMHVNVMVFLKFLLIYYSIYIISIIIVLSIKQYNPLKLLFINGLPPLLFWIHSIITFGKSITHNSVIVMLQNYFGYSIYSLSITLLYFSPVVLLMYALYRKYRTVIKTTDNHAIEKSK